MTRAGKVFLVGSGPGDPELLTLRGAAVLRTADVVIYDALVNPELLDLAPPQAERIDVGKRGHDTPTRPQPEITELILAHACRGSQVVRLKGGDPFVFGRGGEEASACREVGIDFEVVPGVSSVMAVPAYAGIPVTDRRHSASFAVVTGHKDPTRVSEETRWDLLGQAVDTLLIVMGMNNLDAIIQRVIDGGLSADTPAAVVMNGTRPEQRCVEAPLSELAASVRAEGLGAPAVIVIGNVVKLRDSLDWFERKPLFGMRVLVTRAADQAASLVDALREVGAEPVRVPMIRLLPPDDFREVDAALDQIGEYDVLLFTSANTVRFFAQRSQQRQVDLAISGARVVCIGPRTAEAAVEQGLPVNGIPVGRFDAEAILDELAPLGLEAGDRVLLPRSNRAREVLPEGLRAQGVHVDAVTVYRNVAPDVSREDLRGQLLRGELQALTFTSPSTVSHFVDLLDEPALQAARRCLVAGIGRVTADALSRAGLEPDVVPERSGARELVEALVERVSGDDRPDPEGRNSVG
ncbi:uroporphyrinogen-III C-methyltransferase [Myxococcota bacterium]|nr:uroporphyrinogen-III C-methyltransferase [Myxococcota bacterium]